MVPSPYPIVQAVRSNLAILLRRAKKARGDQISVGWKEQSKNSLPRHFVRVFCSNGSLREEDRRVRVRPIKIFPFACEVLLEGYGRERMIERDMYFRSFSLFSSGNSNIIITSKFYPGTSQCVPAAGCRYFILEMASTRPQ